MAMAATVRHGEGATLHERAKWRAGEHQGARGKLTMLKLSEEGARCGLSACGVVGVEDGGSTKLVPVEGASEMARGGHC